MDSIYGSNFLTKRDVHHQCHSWYRARHQDEGDIQLGLENGPLQDRIETPQVRCKKIVTYSLTRGGIVKRHVGTGAIDNTHVVLLCCGNFDAPETPA